MNKVIRSMDLIDYQRLFTRSGFIEMFMRQYWATQDQIMSNVKGKLLGLSKPLMKDPRNSK